MSLPADGFLKPKHVARCIIQNSTIYALFVIKVQLVGITYMKTNDARCTREMKSTFVITKAAFNNRKTLFTSKWGLNLRKKLVKCDI